MTLTVADNPVLRQSYLLLWVCLWRGVACYVAANTAGQVARISGSVTINCPSAS